MKSFPWSTVLFFTISLFASIDALSQKDLKSFNKANKKNSIEAFQKFIDDYPESGYAKIADEKIKEKKYAKLILTKNILDYHNFVKEYPEADSAAVLIEKIKKELTSTVYFIVNSRNCNAYIGLKEPFQNKGSLLDNLNLTPLPGTFDNTGVTYLQSLTKAQCSQIEIIRIEHNKYISDGSLQTFPGELTINLATMLFYLPNIKTIEISYDIKREKDNPKLMVTLDQLIQNHLAVTTGKKEPAGFSEGMLAALVKTLHNVEAGKKIPDKGIEYYVYREKKFNN